MGEEELHDDIVFYLFGMSFAGIHYFVLLGNLCGFFLDSIKFLGGNIMARCKKEGNDRSLKEISRENLVRVGVWLIRIFSGSCVAVGISWWIEDRIQRSVIMNRWNRDCYFCYLDTLREIFFNFSHNINDAKLKRS